VHSADDGTVPVTNSLRYYKSLLAFKVPAEIHIYEEGGHGYGMGNEIETNSTWPNLLLKWMKMHDWL
jgi:dipeptidyl aminopeptidase/acylaminoacyl peptidase